jgi:hypothetical protein
MRHMEKIKHLDDERQHGNGYLVSLKPGYALLDANMPNAQHVFGEEKVSDVWKSMRGVKQCRCEECVALRAQVSE